MTTTHEPIHRSAGVPAGSARPTWNFLTNYAIALVYVALHPDSTVRTISADIGITERAALSILRDLDDEGIVERHRSGRRNTYAINFSRLGGLRRANTAGPLTPRPFVDAILQMLFDVAKDSLEAPAHRPPRIVGDEESEPRVGAWGFFTNNLLILLAVARDDSQTVRELAQAAEVTERAAVAILNQLEADGIIERRRAGRRNSYTIDFDAFLGFRGWRFESWEIPPQLIKAAAVGIRSMSGK
jgi:DNA-binding MarR family transcriptional regulator